MIDLKFGDPTLIRSLLNNTYPLTEIQLGYKSNDSLEEFNIIKWVKNYYKVNFNLEYKHILLTHGATGALDIALNYFKDKCRYLVFQDLAFAWYDKLAIKHDYHVYKLSWMNLAVDMSRSVHIVDSPNNPWGLNLNPDITSSYNRHVIWDSVYAANSFTNLAKFTPPKHDVMVGSLSKIFGTSGLRLGWIGANNDMFAKNMQETISTTYCGLSSPSLIIADHLLSKVDLDKFTILSKSALDYNRNEFNKLSDLFNITTLENGMFYMGRLEKIHKKILSKADVVGLEMADTFGNQYIRFNIAQSHDLIRLAVKQILKADYIQPKKK